MILNMNIDYFETEDYKKSLLETLKSFNDGITDEKLLYIIKNLVVFNNFEFENNKNIKLLLFYYFYLKGGVEFDNGYKFSFNNNLDLNLNKLLNINNTQLSNFKQYFDFGKNEIFLNKIIDLTVLSREVNADKKIVDVDNIIDFFFCFTKECSELYSFSGEHFPLFKWLINDVV
ncbi:MAG: hypothetical protein PHV23_03370 [Candidatus Gracilibacteria bacterium]|nr:hypothetical protein [Candidatus Gracilibacteria bacterium]